MIGIVEESNRASKQTANALKPTYNHFEWGLQQRSHLHSMDAARYWGLYSPIQPAACDPPIMLTGQQILSSIVRSRERL
jgi:hypothetical protein